MRRTLPAIVLLAAAVSTAGFRPPPAAVAGDKPPSQVAQALFGKLADGTAVQSYTLANRNGVKAKIIDYGGIVTELHVPDKDGKSADVVLGFDNLDGYLKGHPYFGSNVGRSANRIAKGKFTLDGKEYTLATNNGPNHLHGGKVGFDKKMWKAVVLESAPPKLRLTYTSPDMEEGYPGTLTATVTYSLTDDNELRIESAATTDKPTLCNLAHHSYFNLAGHNAGTVLDHQVEIFAKNYTPTDDTLIPTGKIEPVAGTPFDFTKPTAIGKRIKEIKAHPVGYDLNYVLDAGGKSTTSLAARVTEPTTGRVMEVLTTEPGLQFYSGNFLDGTNKGKGGAVYQQYHGFCMEPQKFPDSINKPEWKDRSDPVLRPGQEYRQTTVYKFATAR